MDPTNVVGRRVLAYLIDGFASFAVTASILSLLDPQWYEVEATGQTSLAPGDTFTLYALLFFFWILQVLILEGLYGWTLGKLAMQIRVVKPDGRAPGPLRALVRYLLWIVDGIPYCAPLLGFGLVVATSSHRRVGDMVANTYVIDAPYFGRMIIPTPDGPQVGPQSVTAEDLGVSRSELRQIIGFKPKDPVYDKALDTYVVWNEKQQRLMQFDKAANTWKPVEPG
jgi:uncharacterized RDD family membrane protein YckC